LSAELARGAVFAIDFGATMSIAPNAGSALGVNQLTGRAGRHYGYRSVGDSVAARVGEFVTILRMSICMRSLMTQLRGIISKRG